MFEKEIVCIIACVLLTGCSNIRFKDSIAVDIGTQIAWNHLKQPLKASLNKLIVRQPELKDTIYKLCASLQDMNTGKVNANNIAAGLYDTLKSKIKDEVIRADVSVVFDNIDFGTVDVSPEQATILNVILEGVLDVLRD